MTERTRSQKQEAETSFCKRMYQRHGEEQDHSGESKNRATPLHERRYILMDASWLWCFVLVWLGDTPGQMRDMLMSHSLLGDISMSPSQKPLVSSATLTWINRWKCTDGVFLAAGMLKHLNTQVFSQFKACNNMYWCTDLTNTSLSRLVAPMKLSSRTDAPTV